MNVCPEFNPGLEFVAAAVAPQGGEKPAVATVRPIEGVYNLI